MFDLEENFDTVFEEVGDGESFTIMNEDGQPLMVLVPFEEYESDTNSRK